MPSQLSSEQDLREGFFAASAPDRGLYGRRRIEFTVYGQVVPQGSARSFVRKRQDGTPFAVTTHDNPSLVEWRRTVGEAARRAIEADREFVLFTGPVALSAIFYIPRPKSAPKSVVVPITRPDLDKCLRGLLDSLSNVLFRDDSQVFRVLCEKRYAALAAPARAEITLEG